MVLGVGALMTILGFLGCCGAWRESPWMLGTVSSLLGMIGSFLGTIGSLLGMAVGHGI